MEIAVADFQINFCDIFLLIIISKISNKIEIKKVFFSRNFLLLFDLINLAKVLRFF